MGSYTDNQNFYLIDGEEFVTVDDITYNIERADKVVRPLIEYWVTDVESVTESDLPRYQGNKFYKLYSNSIWVYSEDPNTGAFGLRQDVNSRNEIWNTTGFTFASGYSSLNQEDARVAWSSHAGMVRWRGKVVLNNGNSNLPTNTIVNFMTVDESILPERARYFFVHGGTASGSSFQVARIFVPAANSGDPRIEFCKYGGNGTNSLERYLSLNDVQYPLEDSV